MFIASAPNKREILKNSLVKKEKALDEKFDNHFATVRQANGQPLNDKRNGQATLNKWERQSDSIRTQKASIEKTKRAIEIEEGKVIGVFIIPEADVEKKNYCYLQKHHNWQLCQLWQKTNDD